jgi:hypothetical protein
VPGCDESPIEYTDAIQSSALVALLNKQGKSKAIQERTFWPPFRQSAWGATRVIAKCQSLMQIAAEPFQRLRCSFSPDLLAGKCTLGHVRLLTERNHLISRGLRDRSGPEFPAEFANQSRQGTPIYSQSLQRRWITARSREHERGNKNVAL